MARQGWGIIQSDVFCKVCKVRQGRGVMQGYNPVRCDFVLQCINHVTGGGSVYVVQSNVVCVAAHQLWLLWVSKNQSNVFCVAAHQSCGFGGSIKTSQMCVLCCSAFII